METGQIKKDPRENEPLKQYSNKLLEFQKKVSAISKDSVNPFFKSKYFDVNTVIDTIKPILNEVGLVITQGFDHSNGHNVLVTLVWDGNDTIARSDMLIPDQMDVQKLGAAITYCRRYSLVSLLLLQGEEDDDGNAPVKPKSSISKTETPKPSSGASTGNGMTDKQNKYIHVLMKEKGILALSEIGIEKIEKPTMLDAKNIIDKLLAYQPNVIQLDPLPNYIPNQEGD